MTVSVIVPVWNNFDLTAGFVTNALKYIQPPNELVMVNNGSTDSTAAFLKVMVRPDRALRVCESKTNLGFGGGNNLGAKAALGDILVFISNDVEFSGDIIAPLEAAFAANPKQLLGPQLLNYDTGWNRFQDKDNNDVLVPYLAGWCVAMTALAFKELEGWDAVNYFTDHDDLDICYDAMQLGYQLTELDLPVRHTGFGTTASKLPGGRMQYTLKSRANFLKKWGLREIA